MLVLSLVAQVSFRKALYLKLDPARHLFLDRMEC